jgi:hypothetical protein
MSLAETQELMRTMQQLMSLLNGVEAKTTKINSDLPQTKSSLATFNQLERVAIRYLAIARRMGLPDEATQAVQVLSELVVMIRMTQMSMNMLMLGTPFGWAMGAAGLIMVGLSIPGLGQ